MSSKDSVHPLAALFGFSSNPLDYEEVNEFVKQLDSQVGSNPWGRCWQQQQRCGPCGAGRGQGACGGRAGPKNKQWCHCISLHGLTDSEIQIVPNGKEIHVGGRRQFEDGTGELRLERTIKIPEDVDPETVKHEIRGFRGGRLVFYAPRKQPQQDQEQPSTSNTNTNDVWTTAVHCSGFKPGQLHVKLVERQLIVEGRSESRTFNEYIQLPDNIDIATLKSRYVKGDLLVEAKLRSPTPPPPQVEPTQLMADDEVTIEDEWDVPVESDSHI